MKTELYVSEEEAYYVFSDYRIRFTPRLRKWMTEYVDTLKANEITGEKLVAIVSKIMDENPKIVSDYKSGKLKAIDALIGKVMKETNGNAAMGEVRKIILG